MFTSHHHSNTTRENNFVYIHQKHIVIHVHILFISTCFIRIFSAKSTTDHFRMSLRIGGILTRLLYPLTELNKQTIGVTRYPTYFKMPAIKRSKSSILNVVSRALLFRRKKSFNSNLASNTNHKLFALVTGLGKHITYNKSKVNMQYCACNRVYISC